MRNQLENYLIVGLFLTTITIPLLLSIYREWLSNEFLNSSSPAIVQRVIEHKNGINKAFNERFIVKKQLYTPYRRMMELVFRRDGLPQSAFSTKNGWLFLGDENSQDLSESKGLINFAEKELFVLQDSLVTRKKWMEQQQIPFFIAVAPNKATFYGKNIPIKQSDKPKKMEQLRGICANKNINFIDLGELLASDSTDNLLYFKTDTHWNDKGGYLGYVSLINGLKKTFSEIEPIDKESFTTLSMTAQEKDIARMMQKKIPEKYPAYLLKTSYSKELPKQLSVPIDYDEDPKNYEHRFRCDRKKLKVLFFRDSFGSAMEYFLRETFAETLFIWSPKFDYNLIQKERPDMVVYQIVERDIEKMMR